MDPPFPDLRMPDKNRPRRNENPKGQQVFEHPARPGQAKGEAFSERTEKGDASIRQAVFRDMEKGSGRQSQKERPRRGIGGQKERCPHSRRRKKPPMRDGSVGNPEGNVQVRKDRAGKCSHETRETGSRKKGNAGGDDPVVQMFHCVAPDTIAPSGLPLITFSKFRAPF